MSKWDLLIVFHISHNKTQSFMKMQTSQKNWNIKLKFEHTRCLWLSCTMHFVHFCFITIILKGNTRVSVSFQTQWTCLRLPITLIKNITVCNHKLFCIMMKWWKIAYYLYNSDCSYHKIVSPDFINFVNILNVRPVREKWAHQLLPLFIGKVTNKYPDSSFLFDSCGRMHDMKNFLT